MRARAAPACLALSLVTCAILACTTYGEQNPGSSSDAGMSDTSNNSQVEASTSGSVSDGSNDTQGTPPVGTRCPPCPASTTCLGAGCVSSDSTLTNCDHPMDITEPGTYVAFVCPGAVTTTLPTECQGGGTHPVAIARL